MFGTPNVANVSSLFYIRLPSSCLDELRRSNRNRLDFIEVVTLHPRDWKRVEGLETGRS